MNDFLKATFNRKKFSGLFINTALGNFAAYLAGSLVTLISTRHVVQRRAVKNLYGVLPRKKIVVHAMPHWLEWLMALMVGFIVMEAVRYWFDHRLYDKVMSLWRTKPSSDSGAPPSAERAVEDGRISSGAVEATTG